MRKSYTMEEGYRLITTSCIPRSDYPLSVTILVFQFLSFTSLLLLSVTILWRRRKYATQTTITISWLYEYLVLVACLCAVCGYGMSISTGLDCNVPDLLNDSRVSYEDAVHPKTKVLFPIAYIAIVLPIDVLTLMHLWWHTWISYTLNRFICHKLSPARLYRPRRFLWLVLGATAIHITRYAIADIFSLRGYFIATYFFSIALVPTSLFLMIRWYVLTLGALRDQEYSQHPPIGTEDHHPEEEEAMADQTQQQKRENPQQQHHHHHLLLEEEDEGEEELPCARSQVRSSGGSSSVTLPSTGTTSGSSSTLTAYQLMKDQGNRCLITRLLRIIGLISFAWVVTASIDLINFSRLYISHVSPNKYVLFVRYLISSVYGFLEVLFLVWDFKCCGDHDIQPSRLARPMFLERQQSSFLSKGVSSFLRRASSFIDPLPSPTPLGDPSCYQTYLEMMNLSSSVHNKKNDKVILFVSTWNMGGVHEEMGSEALAQLLRHWIPLGYDLYVIGNQECQWLPGFRKVVHEYLGGSTHYAMFCSEIGDATILHGHIGLTIFARAADVANGLFTIHEASRSKVATGVAIGPMVTLPNKGMSGLSARYYDTSLAFITAHFASDRKGRNRLGRRNKDACTSLRDLSLQSETTGVFDVHHQHCHTFLLGDLNYRTAGSPGEILDLISQSAKAEAAVTLKDDIIGGSTAPTNNNKKRNWRACHYQCFFDLIVNSNGSSSSSNNNNLSKSEKVGLLSMKADNSGSMLNSSSSPWRWIKDLDELHRSRQEALVFYNFHEAEITFPPSYRWNRYYPSSSTTYEEEDDDDVLEAEGEEKKEKRQREERAVEERQEEGEGGEEQEGLAGDFTLVDRLWMAYTTSLDGGSHRHISSTGESVGKAESGGGGGGAGLLHPQMSLTRSASTTIHEQQQISSQPDMSSSSTEETIASSITTATLRLQTFATSFMSSSTSALHPSSSTSSGLSSQRTPSYTDRILTHSLPGRVSDLTWHAYDSCDLIELSDHRPVAAAFEMKVDKSIRGFTRLYSSPEERDADQLVVFSFSIRRPHYKAYQSTAILHSEESKFSMMEGGEGEQAEDDDEEEAVPLKQVSPKEVTVVFPLISEDSVQDERVATALSEAFPGFNQGIAIGGSIYKGGGGTWKLTSSSIRSIRWIDFPSKFQIVASKRFSQHMMMKVTDSHGQDLGQIVFPITLGMKPPCTSDVTAATTSTFTANTDDSSSMMIQIRRSFSSTFLSGNNLNSHMTSGGSVPTPTSLPLSRNSTSFLSGLGGGGGGEGSGGRNSRPRSWRRQPHRSHPHAKLKLPVTSGGALKGYLDFEFKVETSPLL